MDCMDASCGHGEHEFRVPGARDGDPDELIRRRDFPCIVYVPENHILAHPECPNRREWPQAVDQADRLWEQETDRTREDPLGSEQA